MGVRLPKPADGDVGINGGRLEAGVVEELLDVADVGADLVRVGRAGAAQAVAAPPRPSKFKGCAGAVSRVGGASGLSVAGR